MYLAEADLGTNERLIARIPVIAKEIDGIEHIDGVGEDGLTIRLSPLRGRATVVERLEALGAVIDRIADFGARLITQQTSSDAMALNGASGALLVGRYLETESSQPPKPTSEEIHYMRKCS